MSLIYLHQDKFLEHVLLLAHWLQGALEKRNTIYAPTNTIHSWFFGKFHFISIILCYGHFILGLDTPGDAECVSGMSRDLA